MESTSKESNADELTKEYEELKAEITRVSTQTDELEREKKDIEAEISENTIQGISIAKISPEEIKEKLLVLYREKSENEAQNTQYKNILNEKNEQEASMNKQFDDMNAKRGVLVHRIEEEKERKNQLENKIDGLLKEINFSKEEMNKRTDEIERMNTSLCHYRKQIDETSKHISESQKMNVHRNLSKFITNMNSHQRGITSVVFSPDYNSFVTASEDFYVKKWDLPSLQENFSLYVKSTPNNIRINQESYFVAFPCTDKIIRVYDFNTWRTIADLRSHLDICTDVLWTSRNQLVSTSKDRTVKLFDLSKNACTATINTISAPFSIASTGSPTVFAVGCFGNIKLVDTRIKKAIELVKGGIHSKTTQITSIITNPTKDKIYSIGLDNKVFETSITGASVIRKMECPELIVKNHLSRISIDPFGGYLAAGSENGNVILFDLFRSESKPSILKFHESPVISTAFSGNMLISTDKKGNIGFWN